MFTTCKLVVTIERYSSRVLRWYSQVFTGVGEGAGSPPPAGCSSARAALAPEAAVFRTCRAAGWINRSHGRAAAEIAKQQAAQVHQSGAWTVEQLQLVVGSIARYIRLGFPAFGGCGGRIRSGAVRPSSETGAIG